MMKNLSRALGALLLCAALAVPGLAQVLQQTITGVGGSGTAYTGTINNATSYGSLDGANFNFTPNTGGTGAATLTINGFGGTAPAIVKPTGSGYAPLANGDLVSGVNAPVTYNFAANQFRLLSAPPSGAAAALPQGYLTPCPAAGGVTGCTAGQLLPTGDVTGVFNLYYEPAFGSTVPIYNGAAFINFQFSELTLAIPSSRALNTIYDVFIISNSGVPTPCFGPAWTTSTAGSGTRGTGASTAQISQVNGVWTNAVSNSCVNGSNTYSVGANQGTYVATCLIDGTAGQVTFNRVWGFARKWACWNLYNRQNITLQEGDSTTSWAYTTETPRPANNNAAGTNSVSVVTGLPLDEYTVTYTDWLNMSATTNAAGGIFGIGVNVTNAFSGTTSEISVSSSASTVALNPQVPLATYVAPPGIGANTYNALEEAAGTNGFIGFGTQPHMRLQAPSEDDEMAVTPVTPVPALNSQVTTGNVAVNAFGPSPNGGFMQNPASAADQGLGAAEDIIVNPVTTAAAPGVAGGVNGTNFRISPGQPWKLIAGQTTPTSVNAASSGHKFSACSW